MDLFPSVTGSSFSLMNYSSFFLAFQSSAVASSFRSAQPDGEVNERRVTVHCLLSCINDTRFIGFLLTSCRRSIWKNHYKQLVTVTSSLHSQCLLLRNNSLAFSPHHPRPQTSLLYKFNNILVLVFLFGNCNCCYCSSIVTTVCVTLACL